MSFLLVSCSSPTPAPQDGPRIGSEAYLNTPEGPTIAAFDLEPLSQLATARLLTMSTASRNYLIQESFS